MSDHDLFISHASEDKEFFVRPLARAPSDSGINVWYDEFTLRVGDSLRRSIDRGLVGSRFGLVIISPHFFKKSWTAYELDGLVAKSISSNEGVILPVWHYVDRDEVARYSPTLADKVALKSTDGIASLVSNIQAAIGSPPTGTRRTLTIGGTANASAGRFRACPTCEGTGLCPKCGGEGGVVDPVFAFLTMGIGLASKFTCKLCDGNKKCPTCNGTARVESLES